MWGGMRWWSGVLRGKGCEGRHHVYGCCGYASEPGACFGFEYEGVQVAIGWIGTLNTSVGSDERVRGEHFSVDLQ